MDNKALLKELEIVALCVLNRYLSFVVWKFPNFLLEKELIYVDFINVYTIMIYLITLESNVCFESRLRIIFTGMKKLFLKFFSCTLRCIHSIVCMYKHFIEKFKNHTPAGSPSSEDIECYQLPWTLWRPLPYHLFSFPIFLDNHHSVLSFYSFCFG